MPPSTTARLSVDVVSPMSASCQSFLLQFVGYLFPLDVERVCDCQKGKDISTRLSLVNIIHNIRTFVASGPATFPCPLQSISFECATFLVRESNIDDQAPSLHALVIDPTRSPGY